ncbi:2-amino-4-hydroxy-6-hydroxymethyldihydropteridine diphosphokinase [candidate division KSB1 bacterium]|nr:2-amino-4-hydroxy-6-hydroxymethyldihydropteridine diphosphokinase [candidate division KSB1 bacterium]
MSEYILGLGANLGERITTLECAGAELANHPQMHLLKVSSLYETEPVGFKEQPDFINGAVLFSSDLPPKAFFRITQTLETRFGRIRNRPWGPRTLDIDILLIDSISIETERLIVPHPQLRYRRFALLPAAELAPNWVIPGSGCTVAEALADCPDSGRLECIVSQHHFLKRVREVQQWALPSISASKG